MDVNRIVADLRSELEQLNEAIMALERIAYGQKRRRGRPPAWLKAATDGDNPTPKRRGRPPGKKNG
jgi:hypothetical protein